MASIFDKPGELRPSTMRTVAERRFGDAEALRRTQDNARANGVAYLAGFVIEILLKAKLVEKYPSIARRPLHAVKDEEREIWNLIWRQHDLDRMLARLDQFLAGLEKRGEQDGYDYSSQLRNICATWTVYARYSSQTMTMDEAARILEKVRRLKEVLR